MGVSPKKPDEFLSAYLQLNPRNREIADAMLAGLLVAQQQPPEDNAEEENQKPQG